MLLTNGVWFRGLYMNVSRFLDKINIFWHQRKEKILQFLDDKQGRKIGCHNLLQIAQCRPIN